MTYQARPRPWKEFDQQIDVAFRPKLSPSGGPEQCKFLDLIAPANLGDFPLGQQDAWCDGHISIIRISEGSGTGRDMPQGWTRP